MSTELPAPAQLACRHLNTAIDILPGARATEARLLELLARFRDEAREDPGVLALPVRVVVPSSSLRLHVAERVASELGAQAGLAAQTLHGTAVEILERAGAPGLGGDPLVDLLARRLAREEPALREAFEPFQDGYRTVSGTARDLIDAGFEEAQLEALLERLDSLRLPVDARRRAEAVARTAARLATELATRAAAGRGELLRRACEAFEADPQATLPARAVLVHGFADTTGRAGDLLDAIARRIPTTLLVDRPPDPADPGRTDLGAAFTERLVERIQGAAGKPREAGPNGDAPALSIFRAPGAEAEAREVARRIRTLLDGGVRPERIGVVARDLNAYRSAIRGELGRLGVPFSGARARAPLDGTGRRMIALVELCEAREQLSTDRWLDAVERLSLERDGERITPRPSAQLRLGLRVVGAGRLGEVAGLDPEPRLEPGKDRMRLPVRTGIYRGEDGAGPFRVAQARLRGDLLRAAIEMAAALARRFERWPPSAPLARHLVELRRLRATLGWRAKDPAELRVASVLERLAEALGEEEVGFDELPLLVRRAIVPVAAPPLGGEGGGVAVLDAMEARGRTFEHLFVVGLNRDVFPRVGREDPLLGDDVRGALAVILPEIPIRARARDEDRYLFAQLASSAPRVSLSWQFTGDDGKPAVISPLVERLLGETPEAEVPVADPVLPADPGAAARGGPRPAYEHAVLAGLHAGDAPDLQPDGHIDELEPRYALALREAGVPEPAEVAGVRRRILDAYERGPFQPTSIAPWLGFLGAQEDVDSRPDPLVEPLFVTRFERLAACPWQTFLRSSLRLEESPDPLESLPGIEKLAIGNVVHKVLQRVAERTVGTDEVDLATALARAPAALDWPEDAELDDMLQAAARQELWKSLTPLPGLVRALADRARPLVDQARDFLGEEMRRFPGGGVLGVEVPGRASVPYDDDRTVAVEFKADLVGRGEETVVLSDYKTGKPTSGKDYRAKAIASAKLLQAMAYVAAVREVAGDEAPVRGRYLFLASDDEVEVGTGERFEDQVGDFEHAVRTGVRGWRAGTFFPRLLDEGKNKQPDACKWCEVSIACLSGESGARRAMTELVGATTPAAEPLASLRQLWALTAREHGDQEGGR